MLLAAEKKIIKKIKLKEKYSFFLQIKKNSLPPYTGDHWHGVHFELEKKKSQIYFNDASKIIMAR